MKRVDGRKYDELRQVRVTTDYQQFAEGSVLIEQDQTKVLCSVSMEEKVPHFLKGSGKGWVTAEYAMLPRATNTRTPRESSSFRVSGRSKEIQRLIGRSLRAVTDMAALGEKSIVVDCDVLQADGGTRTAAITGSYIALALAVKKMMALGLLAKNPLITPVAAISVGLIRSQLLLDLCYDEDSGAEADFNIVKTGKGEYVEVQGTAEGKPYKRETIDLMLNLADKGIEKLLAIQQEVIEGYGKA
jgi:ribonuclease PH